jgi:signal transduction histidine kinase
VDRLASEVRAFANLPHGVLESQVNGHATSLVRLLREGDSGPLLAFYTDLVHDGRKRGLGLPDMVTALILGRGLLRRLARESAGELGAAWDEAIAESFDLALTLLVSCHESAVEDSVKEAAQSEHLAGLGRLSASVAHEIKNPIAGLRGAMEIISQVHRPDDPRFLIFQEALAQIRRLDSLVKDLLAYAKPVNLNLEPVPVEFLVEAALPMVRDQISEAGVDLRTEIPPWLPRVLADPQHIPQVFSNLLQNGAQAMAPGGVLTVSAEVLDGEVAVRVRDTGCGISQENLAKIFQPFFTTKHIGTGLGLSIVQRILSAHGGRCEASVNPEGGAVFSVFLRAALPEPAGAAGPGGMHGESRAPGASRIGGA